MDWLRAERPSVSTLTYSIDTLLFSIISMCLRYVGYPVDVRAGLLSKKHVEAIINSVCFEREEIKKENEVWREAEIVTKAAHLGLALEASNFSRETWIACCPGTNHSLELQPKQNPVLLRLLQGRRRHRQTRRVRCPEKEYSCRSHKKKNLELTS